MDDSDSPKASLRESASRILGLARGEWRALAVGTVFLGIGSAMGLAYPQAVRVIVDGALTQGGATINRAAAAMVVIFVVQSVAVAFRYYLFTAAGERIVTRLREMVYRRIVEQEIAFFDQRRTGELMSRLSSDTTVLQNTVSVNVSMALRNLLITVGGIALMTYTSPRLTAVMLLIVPTVALAAVVAGRRISNLSKKAQDALAEAGEVAEETIAGIRTVRSFAREEAEAERYGEAVWRSFALAKRRVKIVALFVATMTLAAYGTVAAVLWFGGRRVVAGELSVGQLTSFVLYTLIVAVAISALGDLWSDFMRARGASERVFELLQREPEMVAGGTATLDRVAGRVALEGVSFSYPSRPDVEVLEDVDIALEPGETVAVVGPSGAGKSTVASLMMRLYDPSAGRILLDGHDIRDLDASWLRGRIGVVAQEPLLFSTSVGENIRYGRTDATAADVESAARAANAHDFVVDLPEGYDTQVGERGVQLSGGQKQRVAIARALLKDPPVLILDEATSALDAESESLVRDALERLMTNRTSLVIAHRLSTVRDADRVVVLDRGRVAETGTHAELMDHDGVYGRLVRPQLVEG